jgi:hypothetical protein
MQCDAPECPKEATNHVAVVMIGDEYSTLEFDTCGQHTHEVAACDDEVRRVTVKSLVDSRG